MAQGGRKVWVWVLGGVLGLGALCCAGVVGVLWWGRGELQEEMSKVVASMTKEEDAYTERFFRHLDAQEMDAAWEMTSADFRGVTSREQFDKLGQAIRRVMGAYRGKTVQSFNSKSGFGTGLGVVDLVYAGQFENGPATITVRLEKAGGGDFRVTSFRVDSPRFLDELTK